MHPTRRIVSLVALLNLLGVVRATLADEWAVVGPRAMGMGGAGVAVSGGGLSTYWNPAGLAPPRAPRADTFWDVEVPISINAAATKDVLQHVDNVADLANDLDFDSIRERLSTDLAPLTSSELQRVLKLLGEDVPELGGRGKGMVSNASAALMGRVWHFGFSIMGLGYAGGQTKVDLSNLALGNGGLTRAVGPGSSHSGELSLAGQQFADSLASQGLATQNQAEEIVFQAEQFGMNTGDGSLQQNIQNILAATRDNNGGSLDRFFTENQSGVDIRGIVLQEYAVAFAHPFFDMVSVGASAKVLYGTTYYKPYSLSDIQNAKDLFKDLVNSKNREESLNLGVDVGALVQPMDWISLGIVGRNLNRPEFDFKGPGKYVVEPQVRAGVGLTPLPGLTLAGDVDLYINHSEALPGYDSQMLGGGAEYALLDILFLRGGVSKNIAEPTENVMFHLGLGLRVLSVDVDLAASIVPEFTKLESGGGTAELPERAGASLLIGVNIPLN